MCYKKSIKTKPEKQSQKTKLRPIILLGKTNSGKTTVAKLLETITGSIRNITYTTRPIRPDEVDGVDYYYLSETEFNQLKQENKFAETAEYKASFGICHYGSTIESYKPGTITILNPLGVESVLNKIDDAIVVYLKASDDILEARALARGDNPKEIKRRLFNDGIDFGDIDSLANLIIETSECTPSEIANYIKRYCLIAG